MEREEITLVARLEELLALDDAALARELTAGHSADVAELLEEVAPGDQLRILGLLDDEVAAAVLLELDPEIQARLLVELDPGRARTVLAEMPSDDIADLLGELDDREAARITGLMAREDIADVQELLRFPEDSAGGIMTTELVGLHQNLTVQQAIEGLRRLAPDAETVYYIYVVNGGSELVGVLSLRDLIVARPRQRLREVMETNVIHAHTDTDQEEVAQMVAKYDLLALPVVDVNHRLVGIVTVDDIIDVLEEEATEDFHRLGGTTTAEEVIGTVTSKVRQRIPWLVLLLLGNMVSAGILREFTATLQAVVALAYFVPVLIGMGGNVGVQSLAVAVRGLATRDLESRHFFGVLSREALVGASLGLLCGALAAAVALFWQHNILIAGVIWAAMSATMAVTAVIGTLVPVLFDRLGVDSAVASGPFITTLSDITGLGIYFGLATWLLSVLL